MSVVDMFCACRIRTTDIMLYSSLECDDSFLSQGNDTGIKFMHGMNHVPALCIDLPVAVDGKS